MVSVESLLQKLQRIDVDSLTETIINENQKQIIELNIDNLAEGKDFHGDIVGTYSTLTAQIAAEGDNKPLLPKIAGQPYNFIWNGDLLPNIFVYLQGSKLHFDSTGKGTDDKLEWVMKNDLLGLSDENAEILNFEILPPKYREKIRNALNL